MRRPTSPGSASWATSTRWWPRRVSPLASTPRPCRCSAACGLISGKEGRPVAVHRIRNADESPTTYRFEPKEQYGLMTEIEDEGLGIYAIYHSHTHTEAYPSATDRARAHMQDPATGELTAWFPGTRYLIASLADTEPLL